jgi:cystathionine gamma-synthase
VDSALGRTEGHIYSRNTNPTVAAFEEKVRILEGAEAATSFSSGMAAVSNTLFGLLAPGDRVVSVKDTYAHLVQYALEQKHDKHALKRILNEKVADNDIIVGS